LYGLPQALEVPSFYVGTYPQEMHQAYASADGLPSDSVTAVGVLDDGTVLVGTDAGLVRSHKDAWKAVQGLPKESVLGISVDGNSACVAMETGVYEVTENRAEPLTDRLPGTPVALVTADASVQLATPSGVYTFHEGDWQPDESLAKLLGPNAEVRDYAQSPAAGTYAGAVAAASGLYAKTADGAWHFVLPQGDEQRWAPYDVRAVAFDDNGCLWFASHQGVGHERADGLWNLYTGADGLPYNDFTKARVSPDGSVWFGTHQGAIHYDGTHWAYRAGRRWLAGNDVRFLAVSTDGSIWLATNAGLSHIYFQPMTLTDKADRFEAAIDKYHRRTPYGYVARVLLPAPGDTSSWTHTDMDNDGNYTGMYAGAEAFAYAVTKDP